MLILACTHYPLIKREIAAFYGERMTILDSSEIIARALRQYLENKKLLNTTAPVQHHFLVSDYTESFEAAARMFFHDDVRLEKHPLWN